MRWVSALAKRPASIRLGARYEAHNVPAESAAGSVCVLRVIVENQGSGDWLREAPDGAFAGLGLFIDGSLAAVGRLPVSTVRPGERAPVAVTVALPAAPGAHRLRFDMMLSGRTWFSEAGVPPLDVSLQLTERRRTRTDELLDLSYRRNPWFFSPGQGVHRSRDGRPCYPVFAESAKGSRVTDVDGREYVDLLMGWGSCLLGHADERVQEALACSLRSSAMVSVPHRLEMEVSEALCAGFGLGDEVVFGKNGSDVTTWAVRAARAATSRRTVVYAGYHGWQDWNGAGLGFAATGIPGGDARYAVRVGYGDRAALEAAVAAHASDLAGILIEPAATAADVDDPHHEKDGPYLKGAEALARRHGGLFMLDEIFTGFRFRGGSAQRHYGLSPDLTCLGKALANGMPLSALAGRNGVLRAHAGRILYMATYRGEAHSYAAALEALRIYQGEDVTGEVWAAGEAIRRGVDDACRSLGLSARLVGPPYRMYFAFLRASPEQRVLWRTLLQQELAKNGVISHKGYVIPSRRHDGEAVERTVAAFAAALRVIRDAADARAALDLLDIPDVFDEASS
jgi:glutamate-1-semialdehyde aminotransferase